tara:strand:+ start:192 stop:809 length:618 start_codon:yes stop_codon:yes gene_type:complete
MKKILFIPLLLSLSIIADDIYLSCETEEHSKYSWFKENIEAGSERHSYLVKISKSFKDLGGYQLVDIDLIQIHEEKPSTSSLREEGRFDIWYIESQKGYRRNTEYEFLSPAGIAMCKRKGSGLKGERYFDCSYPSDAYPFKIDRESLKFTRHKGEMGFCSISTQENNKNILSNRRAVLKDIIKLEKENTDKEKQKELDQLKRNKI